MRCGWYLLILCFASAPAFADDPIDVARGVEQAKAIAKAVLDEDYAKVADATHPAIVQIMGGREKMIDAIKQGMKTAKDMGIKITSHQIGKPGEPVVDGKTAYLIIPTTLEMASRDLKIVSKSYLLGTTSDGGKTWHFADGAGLSQPGMKEKVFPKLPKQLKLPERKPPTVTKQKPKEKEREKK